MRQPRLYPRGTISAGFSLIELLVVMGIIAAMAAVALPAISQYVRNYQIRGATQQVVGELQAARNKAITKNVNLGVVFITRSATTYQWAIEDDQTGVGASRSTTRPTLNPAFLGNAQTGAGADVAQVSPVFTLPPRIQFDTTCPAPAPTGGAWKSGMRFDRLGAWCDPAATTPSCPAIDTTAGVNLVYNNASGSLVCITQGGTGLRRSIAVYTGGRVAAVQR